MAYTKLTPELQKVFVKCIADGNYIVTACAICHITEQTYYNWLDAAKEGEQPYLDFVDAVQEAEAKAEQAHVKNIKSNSFMNWQASAWYLERKHSDRWGRKDKLSTDNKTETNLTGDITVNVGELKQQLITKVVGIATKQTDRGDAIDSD